MVCFSGVWCVYSLSCGACVVCGVCLCGVLCGYECGVHVWCVLSEFGVLCV